ncbi:hypothetical protein ACFSQD_01220 [Flavihumibacter stibioxidans]|uniref:Uncharacterized protein n=1 Tax=Flavihumibacter stibioxidans TaxID=1834163 RepID=A0ABR7MAY1_9BACT|nr:hypothetical protein [Flavihumibacter stibioxidans]MBC6492101.1 hypothetical protein [Flavihumibacter stibioxidans]
MKLLIVTCLKENQKDVSKLFHEAGIKVFSVTETVGFKDDQEPDLVESWFSSGEEKYDSLFLFSFTGEEQAKKVMESVNEYNRQTQTQFPLRAFVMPVEASSN